ncbi:uncharacterized protein TRUGW13939_00819 [Talaromyces rugulosus]|uniref:Fucose-specific lectin n=1 Tax=Talaromyces rugulosus TaxID=121627 RepID=A0A7H8QIC1_TALRU|nr:uncharacterized protein TRUGW13939_00819 [Talaromyces rugulosus]QKX53739.1 hypothetical protein TRUGW13939_00819 [Talaromyces rugulosus]
MAATSWTENGGATQIRVFFLDEQNNIRQSRGDHETMSQWSSITIGLATETEISPGSQLAIARPDQDDQLLRLFYQQKSDAGRKAGGSLREIRYDASDQVWAIQDNAITDDAIEDTRLSAVSDKLKQDVRLYFQGSDMQLREMYCDGDYRWSYRSLIIQKRQKLGYRAPISAVCWRSDQLKLQIRVFTLLATNKNTMAQMSYNHPNWKTISSPAVSFQEGSGVGSCRDTGTRTVGNTPICVFYQPGSRIIELWTVPADDSTASHQMEHKGMVLINQDTAEPSSSTNPAMATENERLEQEVRRLTASLNTAESNVTQLQTQINGIDKEKSALNDGNVALHKETELLRSEIEKLKEQNNDGAHWKSMYETLHSSTLKTDEGLDKLASLTPLHSRDASQNYDTMRIYRNLAMDGWARGYYMARRHYNGTYHYYLRNEDDWPSLKNSFSTLFGADQSDWPKDFRL